MTANSARPQEAERLARQLELTVSQRLDGLLRGDHLGILPGPGWEVGEARPYAPGDDVRRIDWSLTARAGDIHVRDTIVERELETIVVADFSPSVAYGTAMYEKRELALAAAAAVGFLTARTGGRLGAAVLKPDAMVYVPPRTGRAHVVTLLEKFAAVEPVDGSGRADLKAGLRAAGRLARRRGLVCVVSDFIHEPGWERSLRVLSQRHEVLAIELVDPRELELPNVGDVDLVDPASGRQLSVSTGSSNLRERFASAAAAQREEIAAAVRGAGAGHLVLRTDRDWVLDVVRFVMRRRRANALSSGAR